MIGYTAREAGKRALGHQVQGVGELSLKILPKHVHPCAPAVDPPSCSHPVSCIIITCRSLVQAPAPPHCEARTATRGIARSVATAFDVLANASISPSGEVRIPLLVSCMPLQDRGALMATALPSKPHGLDWLAEMRRDALRGKLQ